MDRKTAYEFLKDLDVDEQHDLLMHLAEEFNYEVFDGDQKVTYYLPNDYDNLP